MQVPKLEKIVINMAVGDAVGNAKILDSAIADLTTIAGQKPVITRARKSLAAWKLRKGMPIGCKVTLRGQRMFDFLDKKRTRIAPSSKGFFFLLTFSLSKKTLPSSRRDVALQVPNRDGHIRWVLCSRVKLSYGSN